jgi:alpha-N-arabinofuranosidase
MDLTTVTLHTKFEISSVDPHRFGTDEFVKLCRRMGWMPMLTVNLGTGTPEEARNWVEYCNCPAGTSFILPPPSLLRAVPS